MTTKDNLPDVEETSQTNQTPEGLDTNNSTTASNLKTKDSIDEALTAEKSSLKNTSETTDINDTLKIVAEEEIDYENSNLEGLVIAFERLLKEDEIGKVQQQISRIKHNFTAKYNTLLEEKKQEFIEQGGNAIDFKYQNELKVKYNRLSKNYRERSADFQRKKIETQKQNLSKRLEIIKEIKSFVNIDLPINDVYKRFRILQDQWREIGHVPHTEANNVWNNYRHHVEIFYDFLHLNRDLRELDYKHNLEKKLKIIEKVEELSQEKNLNRAFRELQALHKIWREDLGPVAKELREELWEKFSNATKIINNKRQSYYKELEGSYSKNLVLKKEIITKIDSIANQTYNNHSEWSKKIKEVDELRETFFKIGKVPKKESELSWSAFKTAVRTFNKNKNSFYKNLKKTYQQNLQKKLELIRIAEENKDNEDIEITINLLKKIQADWKKIGHVPRKDSERIWKEFRVACNYFFERVAQNKIRGTEQEEANFNCKETQLKEIKKVVLNGTKQENIQQIEVFITNWKKCGKVAHNKRHIDSKFKKTIDGLYQNLKLDAKETELLKFNSKLVSIADDEISLNKEYNFTRKKLAEIKAEINQLENNLLFFSNVDQKNPLLINVQENIANQKEKLEIWQSKYQRLKRFIN